MKKDILITIRISVEDRDRLKEIRKSDTKFNLSSAFRAFISHKHSELPPKEEPLIVLDQEPKEPKEPEPLKTDGNI